MLRRKLTIIALALTSVGGFAWGFSSLRHCAERRRQHIEEQARDICSDAARQAVQAELAAARALPAAPAAAPVEAAGAAAK